MKLKKIIYTTSICLVLSACSSGNCKRQDNPNFFTDKTKDLPEFKDKVASKTGLGEGANLWIRVYKADGSLQCGMGAPITPELMSKELEEEEIKIRKLTKDTDGFMRIQVCGSPTGKINVFEIQEANKDRALELGFKVK